MSADHGADPSAAPVRHVTCYMDGTDWDYHLANDGGGTRLFPSVDDLKDEMPCVVGNTVGGGCGIVEVEVRFVRWVERSK